MDKSLKLASFIAAILGGLDALYLLIYKITSAPTMCLGSGDCATVNSSPYSEIRGIPISLLGLLAYLAIIGIHMLESRMDFFKQNGILLNFGISLVGVLFSAYLTYVELYVIHAVCPFCVASAILITIVFIIAIIRLTKQTNL
jgi:uncharacterized membrane protein